MVPGLLATEKGHTNAESCFYTPGNTYLDRWGQPRASGGVLVMADKRFQTTSV